jgi:thiamine transport system permease protein
LSLRRFSWLLWCIPLLFLGLFYFYPLGALFQLVFEDFGKVNWTRIFRPLGFTFYQATLSTILTLLIGLPGAYVFARFTFPGKALLRSLMMVPFILPTVVVAAGFNALLGPRGWMNLFLMRLLSLDTPPLMILNTLGMILLAHVFYNTSVVIRIVGSAWAQLDTHLEDAGRVLGASPLRTMREISMPLLRPSFLAATLLVFLFDFTSFGVILLLGGPRYATLEVEIYIQALHMLNLPLAGILSVLQLICTLILTLIYLRISGGEAVSLSPRIQGEGTMAPRTWRQRLLVISIVMVLLVLLVSPLTALGLRSVSRLEADRAQTGEVEYGLTLAYYRELFINRRGSLFYVPPAAAIRNSLVYGLATVGISLTLGFLAAYTLLGRSLASRLLDPLLMLPLGTSAVTLGLGFIVVFNRPPLDISSFPLILPIAHSLVALPIVVRSLQPALMAIPVSLRHSAAVLGASPWRVWREVDLPIVARAAVVGAIFAFTISLGEFGASSFLSRPEYPTMPVAIYRFLSQPGAMNYGQAMAMSTILMLVCIFSVILLDRD